MLFQKLKRQLPSTLLVNYLLSLKSINKNILAFESNFKGFAF